MTAIGERAVALSSKLVDRYGGRAGKVVRVCARHECIFLLSGHCIGACYERILACLMRNRAWAMDV